MGDAGVGWIAANAWIVLVPLHSDYDSLGVSG